MLRAAILASVSKMRGAEEVGPPDDGSRGLATILTSLGVALVNFKVAELFCSNRFGDAAVDVGFEHGLEVDYATGWDMEDEEQMQEVERRVMEEEPVLLIGSPTCRSCDRLIELARVTGQTGRGQAQRPVGTMRTTSQVLFQNVRGAAKRVAIVLA